MTDILHKRYCVAPGIAVRKIKGEIFFITPASAELHTLNQSGIEIFDLLTEGKTPLEIIDFIILHTNGSPQEVRSDIEELMNSMISKGIIVSQNE